MPKINLKISLKSYGEWGLGIGDWGLGPNPQSPIPNPQSPIPNPHQNLLILFLNLRSLTFKYFLTINKIYLI
jgi:hypothetical protein